MRGITTTSILAALLTVVSGPALAQSGSDSVSPDIIKALQDEIEKLRLDNQKMRGEIDELHAKTEDNWLTEERAEQIKALVADVLADADTRASLQDGIMAGWSDHFFLASADGRFKLVFEGLEQIRWNWAYQDNPPQSAPQNGDTYRYGFENARTYLTFRGHVFSPDLTYLVRGDFSRANGTEGLLDAWVRYNMTDHWSFRVGQFKLPFMREELVYDGYMQTVERSLINFTNSAGRSQGIELTYGAEYDRFSAVYSDGSSSRLSGLNPNRMNTPWDVEDTEWAFIGRYEHLFGGSWGQFTDFTSPVGDEFGLLFGIAFQGQESESGVPNFFGNDSSLYGYTVDVSVEFGGANVYASWVHNYVDSPSAIVNFYGIVLQAGLYVAPKWEIFSQFQWGIINPNTELDVGDLLIPSIGVNYYIEGQDVKFSFDVGYGIDRVENFYLTGAEISAWRADSPGENGQVVIRTQLQLLW